MIEVPFLSYEQLKRTAEMTLESSRSARQIPVDIELLVERDFGIEIIPFRGLQERFGIDAFISQDAKSISVDEFVLENRINRYRFSLAHELGHRVLHDAILKSLSFPTIQAWKSQMSQIPEREYSFLEYQANTFANCLLLPSKELAESFQRALAIVRENGIEPAAHPEVCLDSISTGLGKQFKVSREAVLNRLKNKFESFEL